jgi:hypothetical protein
MRRFKTVRVDGAHFEPTVVIDQKKPWLVVMRRKFLPEFEGEEYTVEMTALEPVLNVSHIGYTKRDS